MPADSAPPTGVPRSTLVTWLGLIVLGVAFLGFLAWSNGARRDYVGKDHPGVGRRLAGLDLVPLVGDGPPVSLESLEGTVVLMNLWGTWCGPCRREFPQLVKLQARLRSHSDFRFLSVSCGQENPEAMLDLRRVTEAYVREMGATFPIYADPQWATRKATFAASHVAGIMPTTLVLDRTGKIRGIWTGYAPGDERVMEQLVLELLAEGATKPTSHGAA